MAEHPTWTIMLYLSGDNNLSPEMVRAINDIAMAGLPADFAVTIQYDPTFRSLPTFRYHLAPATTLPLKPHAGPIPLADFAEPVPNAENAADPQVLSDFINWSLEKAPSTYRMLVLSGHGAGAIGDFLTDNNVLGRQLPSLSIPRLHDALNKARRKAIEQRRLAHDARLVHILGMDSCLMSTAEVGYEVRDGVPDKNPEQDSRAFPQYDAKIPLVQYMVGSEGFVPNAGWPYGHLFQKLQRKYASSGTTSQWKRDPASLSKYLVDDVVDYYTNFTAASVSVDMAGCELQQLDAVVQALRNLTNELLGKGNPRLGLAGDPKIEDMVILAHWRAQSFKFEQNTDLGDFCDLLKKAARGTYNGIADAAHVVNDAIDVVVGRSAEPKSRQDSVGVDFQYASGLSVYFPWRLTLAPHEYSLDSANKIKFPELKTYKALRFARDTGWGDFLETYLATTMRPPKEIKGGKTIEQLVVDNGVGGRAGPKFIEGINRFIEGTNKFIEGTNRFIEGTNRFQDSSGELFGNMKNPPQQTQVEISKLKEVQAHLVAP
jgi:Clostripain family